ncbi:erythromycin esterase family protein [Pseudoflavitalea sp. X16]|uniref:erythromycin esterase family protein n=1 Tax=Paraflavitalea devenefica TaxID=2716334 RepID=UPI001423AD49|nr:erythromycin esterase family protein [Paraflavitalea devenefica]NII29313.1 erythromycin esterase family protein [Paraflavitalea devenefica]
MRTYFLLPFILICLVAPAQDKALQEYLNLYAKEINPAIAGFQGFSFLDSLLKGKRIVALGESSHGTEEYSATKFQLIQYMHEKLGYNVLLFESPMANCSYVNLSPDTATRQLVRNSIQAVWHTETVRRLFAYVKERHIRFGGFDPQFMYSPYPEAVLTDAFETYPPIKNTLLQLEHRIAATITTPRQYLSLKDSFSAAYDQLAVQLSALPLSPLQQWMKQMITTNISYYARINQGDQRDSCMAKNIIWMAENLYPHEKIIIWAHNTHIDKNPSHKKMMGKLLAAHFKDQFYGIGLYMVNGTTALNNRTIIPVQPAPKGSLEEALTATGFRTTFIETGHPLFDRKMVTLHWGKDRQFLTPGKSYDAIVLVNGVRPPDYLKE